MANRDSQPGERYSDYGRNTGRDHHYEDYGRTDFSRDASSGRDDWGRGGGYGEQRQFRGEQSYGRPGQYRTGANRYEDYGQYPQGVRQGGDRYGQGNYGDRSGSGAYGEGGFLSRSGSGGYGAEGYGGQDFRSEGRYGQAAGGTYGQRDFSNAARRSLSHEDQRYGDHGSLGETYDRDYRQRDETYGALSRNAQYGGDYRSKYDPLYEQAAGRAGHVGAHQRDRDHDQDEHHAHYRRWREDRLASHDRDYSRWRDEQAQRYDADYQGWRDQRHQTFARDFDAWRQDRGRGAGDETAILGSVSPTGPMGGGTGLTGASAGTSPEEAGIGGRATGVSNSGGGATGAAQISGGSSGVAAAVSDAAGMGGAAAAHLEGSTGGYRTAPADRTTTSGGLASMSGQTASSPVQSVSDGHTGGERHDDDRKKH